MNADPIIAFVIGRKIANGEQLPEVFKFETDKAGPMTGAALGKWLGVDGAAADLKSLDLRYNQARPDLGEVEQAAIKEACPDGVKPQF